MKPTTPRKVLAIAVPAMATNVAVAMVGLVDSWVVGQLPGATPQAGTVLAVQFLTLLLFSFNFLQFGSVGLSARARGAGEATENVAVLLRALLVALCIGVALLVLHPLYLPLGLDAYDAPVEVRAVAASYFAIRIWAAPFILANMAMTGWLLGQQRPRTILAIELGYNLVNLVLSLLLGLHFGFGVRGVAFASVAAESTAWLLLILASSRMTGREALRQALHRPVLLAWTRLRATFAVNRDLFLRTLLLMLTIALFTRAGAGQGAETLAANGIVLQLCTFSALLIDGFEAAAQTLCGEAVGASDGARFRALVIQHLKLGAILMLGLALFWLLASPLIIPLFTRTTDVVQIAMMQRWALVAFVLFAWCFILDGVFVGAGWTVDMLLTMAISFVLFLFLLAFNPWGNAGQWIALLGFLLARSLVQSALYRRRVAATFPHGIRGSPR